ncbi:hypothetical protein [Kordiimonas aquimaris]|uniref:hypothetical protein n=1 Tax=Kordiimonas aquimaris TaxID=707591 RepID=UPI0021D2226E|nr:hypothetical protein [Kordiimonas aquimaris]
MSKEYDKAAFMTRLLLGENLGRDVNFQLDHDKNEDLMNDVRHMKVIAARMRTRVNVIIGFVRSLSARHESLSHKLELEYSAYENIVARLEMKRHWALYRRAMQEYHMMFDALNKAVDKTPARKSQIGKASRRMVRAASSKQCAA